MIHFNQKSIFTLSDKICNKELNNMAGSWEPFLPSLCLNVHFLEVYTDASAACVVCMQMKYQI